MKRIHIVGSSPRTGTTLMTELFVNGFHIDGFTEHEVSIFKKLDRTYEIFCSKNPQDIMHAPWLLHLDQNLWFIHMLRDPRDVVVSFHGKDKSKYWTNLRIWNNHHSGFRKVVGHPRFIPVRYEDLVCDPDSVQTQIMEKIPFLKKRIDFSEFHRIAKPSENSLKALKGLRPINRSSIGAWRNNKSRLLAQIEMHGSIDKDLIDLGYETDEHWKKELNEVIPNNYKSNWPDEMPKRSISQRVKLILKRYRSILRYALQMRNTDS